MLKLKEKWQRIRRRHSPDDKADHEPKKRRFPKLDLSKIGFLAKLKRSHKPQVETNERPPTPETPDVSQGGIEDTAAECHVWCGGNGLQEVDQEINDTAREVTNEDAESNDNLIQIKVECHENEDSVSFKRTPVKSDRMSKSSLGSGLLSVSRASMLNRSISNISVGSSRSCRNRNMRTVWTQASLFSESGLSTERSQEMFCGLDVEGEVDETEKSRCSSIDFGIDEVLKEYEVNEKLLEVKDKIEGCLMYPNLANCEASVCVDMLRISKVPFLVALNTKILSEEGYFNEEFIVACGIDILLEELGIISARGLANVADVAKSLLISECIAALFNSESGRKFIMENGEHIACVAKGRFLEVQLF